MFHGSSVSVSVGGTRVGIETAKLNVISFNIMIFQQISIEINKFTARDPPNSAITIGLDLKLGTDCQPN